VTVEKCKTVKGDVVEKDIPVDTGFIGKWSVNDKRVSAESTDKHL
jgi:hypothetical protein